MSKSHLKRKVNDSVFKAEVDAYRILSNAMQMIENTTVININNLGAIQEAHQYLSSLRDSIPKVGPLAALENSEQNSETSNAPDTAQSQPSEVPAENQDSTQQAE